LKAQLAFRYGISKNLLICNWRREGMALEVENRVHINDYIPYIVKQLPIVYIYTFT